MGGAGSMLKKSPRLKVAEVGLEFRGVQNGALQYPEGPNTQVWEVSVSKTIPSII